MKKATYILLGLFLLSHTAFTQKKPSSGSKQDSLDIAHKQASVYQIIQSAWIANQEVSYGSIFPYVASVGKRRIPLRERENSSSDFYLLEANMDLRFPLLRERFSDSPLKKRVRLTFDYIGNFRMTNDESHPLTPGSHRFGFGINTNLFNNCTGWIAINEDVDFEKQNFDLKPKIKFLNLLINLHHYSNGQPPGFYYIPDPNFPEEKRNDYIGGDFSTNYIYFEITGGTFRNSIGSLHQFSAGTRFDLGTDESLFAFSKEQENSYGRTRLILKYDFRTQKLSPSVQHHLRINFEHIIGDLSAYIPNLESNSKKYRSGIRLMYELSPTNYQSLGFFISFYYGRDYLNIRFDEVIYSAQIGVTFSLNKYFTPQI